MSAKWNNLFATLFFKLNIKEGSKYLEIEVDKNDHFHELSEGGSHCFHQKKHFAPRYLLKYWNEYFNEMKAYVCIFCTNVYFINNLLHVSKLKISEYNEHCKISAKCNTVQKSNDHAPAQINLLGKRKQKTVT